MNPLQMAFALMALALQMAPDVIQKIIEFQQISGRPITLDDIQALQGRIQPPQQYFSTEGEQP